MNLLKAKIVEKGLTISEVAKALKVSEQAVYMMIRGERTMNSGQIAKLKSLLGLNDSDMKSIFLPVKWKILPPERR